MSHFVSLDGEHGFWVGHAFYEVWLTCLALHIELDGEEDSFEAKIVARWLYAGKAGVRDFGLDQLDQVARNPRGRDIMRAAVTALMESLSRLPDPFHSDAFGLLGLGGEWGHGPVPRRDWQALSAAFLDLLDGKIRTRVGDRVDVLSRHTS